MSSEPRLKTSQWAILVVFIGWFLLDTLSVTVGSLQHSVRFFDISAVIADPRRILFGIDSWLQRGIFGSLCVVCLAAPVLARQWSMRFERWACLGPLVLMMVCGYLLYSKTSAEFLTEPNDLGSVGHSVMHFAVRLARQGSALIAKHISVGLGGYVAFVGAVVLAADGWRR